MDKSYISFLILFTLFSCNVNKNASIDRELIEVIRNSKFELFEGVNITASHEKNGFFKAPFLSKELDGEDYVLPNFNYFDCNSHEKDCLEKRTTKSFDIIDFYEVSNKSTLGNPYAFSYKYTFPIFSEFEKIKVYRIVSDSDIGNCIIFFIDKKNYLAYVPDVNEIENEVWKSRFTEENRIDWYWYSGKR